MIIKILATLSILGMTLGLFTESELTGRTVVIYIGMILIALAGVWTL